jgi:phosphatidylglycerol:prolipoprotein diacylglycerol transferase
MRPIPVAFHVWFLEVHTYGIGLALTFWFGLRYTERRLRNAGYPWQWVTGMFVWVIVAAIVGARVLHVVSDLSYYSHNPGQIVAIWQGGLSSFGGLLFAVPVAIVSSRRRCPQLATMRFADLMAPVLMACWGIGRLLGPQMMVAGGGHATNQWFGMYYAGQPGKRLPVPIFQSMEDLTIFGILLLVERWLRISAPTPAAAVGGGPAPARLLPPSGIVLGVGMVLWGVERFLDEHLWLGEDGHLGSLLTQGAGILLAVAGVALLISRIGPLRRWRRGEGGDPAPGRPGPGEDAGVPDDPDDGSGAPVDATPTPGAQGTARPPAPVPSVATGPGPAEPG